MPFPIAHAAADKKIEVRDNGNKDFSLYVDGESVQIDNGKFQTGAFTAYHTKDFTTKSLIETITKLQTFKEDYEYGNIGWRFNLFSDGDSVDVLFNQNHGVAHKGHDSQVGVVTDALLFEVVKRVNAETDMEALRKLKADLSSINYTRPVSKTMEYALESLDIKGLDGVKKFIEDRVGSVTSNAVQITSTDIIFTQYVTKIRDGVAPIDIDTHKNAWVLAVVMTWKDFVNYAEYDTVTTELGIDYKLNPVERAEALWKMINDSDLEDVEKASLYNVFKMRTAITKDSDINAPNLADQEPNQFAPEHIEKLYGEIQDLTSSMVAGTTESLISRYTFDLRLKYHYYGMQMQDPHGSVNVDAYTQNSGSDIHYYGVDIPLLRENIVNAEQYVQFNNVMQELPLARDYILSSVLTNLTEDNKASTEAVEAIGYLRALKAGITFLESLPNVGNEALLDGAISYWYSGTPSMESIYQTVVSQGLINATDDSSVPMNDERPLSKYFDIETGKLSLHLRIGIAQSTRYIPLKTNLYEPSTYNGIENEQFLEEFHYKWGYHRKALYIDTSARAAVNLYNTGKPGSLKVATLKDVIDNNNDIVLYTDTSFYNENKLLSIEEKAIDMKEKAEGKVEDIQAQVDEVKNKWDQAEAIIKFDLSRILETTVTPVFKEYWGKITEYSQATLDKIKASLNPEDELFLSKEAIIQNLEAEEYSVLKPFAVTSAIYRDKKTYDFLEKYPVEPVFISSESLGKINGTNYEDKSSIMNHTLVQNMKANRLIDYKSSLDYNSPLFIDIYGNISTSTGYVVIPAASNATLHRQYNPYNAGLISTYGKEHLITKDHKFPDIYDNSDEDGESNTFTLTEDDEWTFKPLAINSLVDLNALATSDEETMQTLVALTRRAIDGTDFHNERFIRNVLMEVMRGAPAEHLDYEAEGIRPNNELNQAGVVQAYKLDQLKSTLETKSQNSLLALPNPAFMPGIEYILFYAYKLGIIVVLIMVLIQIFIMTMRNQFNLMSIAKMIASVGLVVGFMYAVPIIMNITYYEANKILLQDETVKISMLNLEKREAGVEIGVSDVQPVDINTELLIKIEDLDLPIADLIGDVVFNGVSSTLSEVYDHHSSNKLVSGEEDVQKINKGIYIDVDDVYDSSFVVFEPAFKQMYQQTRGTNPISFYMPYYVILDSLIANINGYNIENQTYSYTTSTFEGGKIKSIGLSDDFFLSDYFTKSEEHTDFLSLRKLYTDEDDQVTQGVFTEDEMERMKDSLWFNDNMDAERVDEQITMLNIYAKEFVVKNRELLNRISDETFLKVMSLHLALEYNKLFEVGKAETLEIFKLSPDDLVRLSISDPITVMEGSTFSYPRYIYEVAGQVGVYLAAILEVILFISGWVKPLITLTIMGVLFINIFVYKLILRVETETVKGSIYTVGYLALLNLIYAVLLKTSMWLPITNISEGVALFALIVMHIIFLAAYVIVAVMVISDFANFGATNFQAVNLKVKTLITETSLNTKEVVSEKLQDLLNRDKARNRYADTSGVGGRNEPPTAIAIENEATINERVIEKSDYEKMYENIGEEKLREVYNQTGKESRRPTPDMESNFSMEEWEHIKQNWPRIKRDLERNKEDE